MVKNKNEDEDEIIERDEDEDDDDIEDDGDSKKSSSKKEDDNEEIEVEVDSDEKEEKDERIAVQGKKPFKEYTQEEKRAHRRRERKLKNSRNFANKRELETVKQVLARLAKENEELKAMAGEFGKREASRDEQQVDSAINSQKSVYQAAQSQFSKAIAEGDGPAAAEAQRIMNDATHKYNQLTALKSNAETSRRSAEVEKKPETAKPENKMVAVYTQRFLAQNDWFDPAGGDEDSKLAKEIDNEVAEEGYDPNTKEYWDEVKKRIKEEMPHVFGEKKADRRVNNSPRPKQVNGSMGADSSSSNVKTIKIPERVIKMAKDAGQWDDPKMRKTFIRNYRAQNETVG